MGESRFDVGGYRVDLLCQGYPGKATCHGGLGWSSVLLLRGHQRTAVIDTGAFGMRKPLISALEALDVKPDDVTDVLLSHAHHDHMINFTLFKQARMVIGEIEMKWALSAPWGSTPVPEVYVKELATRPGLHLAQEGEEVLPGISVHLAPGHTPGHLVFVVAGEQHDLIVVQDAAKNRAELVSRCTDMTYDASLSAASIDKIMALWQRRPGSILVPGHDLPMVLENGSPKLLGKRRAGIAAVFGSSLDETTLFDLTGA
jgi:glyoxylase-like metal-dependent hydrolase (beta-lactamase superfamily II)